MLVMKFGGTSVGNGERILEASRLIANERERHPVVIVSAMSQVTNALFDLIGYTTKASSEAEISAGIDRLRKLHHDAAKHLELEDDIEEALLTLLDSILSKLEDTLNNVALLGELTPRAHDLISSFGERLSIHLVVAALQHEGLAAVALEASELIVTDDHFGHASPLFDESRSQMKPRIQKIVDSNSIPVITGFMGANKEGIVTTLGRGGSDFSATIFGYCLDAEEVWIWTDVDGVMTADPRIIKGAHTIDQLSYDEAAELSYFGAKVLHPRTMVPASLGNIPIRIKNTMRPSVRGTKITNARSLHPDGVKAMTVLRNLSLITVQGKGMQGVFGIAAKAFTTLAEEKINILFISQASSENNISLVVKDADGSRAAKALKTAFTDELQSKNLETVQEDKNMAMIAVVGEGLQHHVGIAGRVFSAVGHAGISIVAIAQGSSERNISLVINEDEATHALQAIHDELHLENGRVKNKVQL